MDLIARGSQRRPVTVVVLLGIVTLLLAGAATRLEVETDITEFGGDAPISAAFDRIDEEFGVRGGGLQVVVDARPGGSVLSPEGLEVAREVTDLIDETIGEVLAAGPPDQPSVVSYATPVLAGLQGTDVEPAELTEPFIVELLANAIEQEGDELRALFSDDLDVGTATARGGIVVVELDPELDEEERAAAGVAVRDRLDREPLGFFDVDAFSFELMSEELEDELFTELPLLLLGSIGLIVLLLWLLFRSVVDVLLGIGGLLVVQVWLGGIAALLGPGWLGLTGPFSQLAVAVPVMLVGLGVDYEVHLVSRIREERAEGTDPARSSERSLQTVGVALVLVTVTTMVGFLSNLQSPIPPIADFGVFTAGGMLGALLVMGALVPAARQLLDRRFDLPVHAPGGGEDSPFASVMGRAAGLAIRFPAPVLVVGLVIGGLGVVAASDLDTEFSQEDFLPDGSRADELIARMDVLFGGDVTEQTFLLLEGDLEDPTVLAAIEEAEAPIADLEDVRDVDGTVDLTSPLSLVGQRHAAAQRAREQLVEQARFATGEADVELLVPFPDELAPEEVPDVDGLDDEGPGGVPAGEEAGAAIDEEALEERLPPGVDRDEALLGLLEDDELAQLLVEGATEELRDGLLATMGEDTAVELAALAPDEVDLARLEAIGYPLDELGAETAELLQLATDLEALGYAGVIADDTDLGAVYDRVAEEAGDELTQVLSDDRQLALVMIPTEAGEDGAQELAAELREAAAPIREHVDDLVVVSEQLVIQETLDLLIDAQVEKILFSVGSALFLLVLYYLFSQRRPLLGLITMVPTLYAIPIILGAMWILGLPFNALTATIASVAVGFGVDYGIHLSNRFREEKERGGSPEEAVRRTLQRTGAALVASAATTSAAFGVLGFSNLVAVAQFGVITAMTMVASLVTTVLAQSSALLLWERYHRRRAGAEDETAADTATASAAS